MDLSFIPTPIYNFLTKCFATAAHTQAMNGIAFQLTIEEYIGLVCAHPYALQSIIKRYEARKAKGNTMKHFKTAYVMSWVSKEARQTGVMDKHTARFMNPKESLEMFKLKSGEKHRPESCLKMSKTRTGVPRSETCRLNISKGLLGHSKSEETKANMRAGRQLYLEAKRLAAENCKEHT